MQLIPVEDRVTSRQFLEVPLGLYKNDPNWIRPLDKDVSDVFDPKKNKAFRFGEIKRWILFDEEENLIGRIAAFINKKYKNKGDEFPAGGIGFFECIDNQDAADLLFDCAKHWLIQHGMEAMDGPINFGERDRWWGLLTSGFDEPLYCMNYNLPYYIKLFETYGFQLFYKQMCFKMDAHLPLTDKIRDRHALYEFNPDFSTRHIEKNKLDKYAEDFSTIYNKAWAGHGGLKQLSKEQVIFLFKKMKPIMDEKIVWFAYYKNDPIAMFVNLPDLNQWFKHLHGKFGIFHKLKFLWIKLTKPNKKCNGIIFGVVPEWQAKGIDAFIIGQAAKKYMQTSKSPYSDYEMQWIGDFNPKMINVAETLGKADKSRELITYRYIFDRTKEFKRHPILVFDRSVKN